ncbi:MAG TPA: DUF2207 domain-containing protein [Candidatus Acidoferrum sp.]|nr:DUF2207 domain-containing protein [Candidatus Acidoferrum sp.]
MIGMKQKRSRSVAALLLATILALAAPAAAKSWRISNFQDTITVNNDGSALVNETISLVFVGEWHGIHRTIPIEYPGPDGTNYQLFIDIKSITDEHGAKLKYDSSTSGAARDLKIYIPNAVDATRTVDIAYRVRNATRFFDQYDEFFWNVTGNDWPVPIDRATASVHFPDSASGSLRAQAFTGVYGSTERDATAKVEGSNAEFATNNSLPMRGGMTIDVYIPKGILKEPGGLTKLFWFIGSNPVVFLPLATLAVMFILWWYAGRDPDPGMSVAPMYEPPTGISPAEAGTLLDDRIHPRDITSTIVDLAVRGFIKIEETDDKGLLFHHKDYIFHLLQKRQDWSGLAPHERVMMENIFTGDVPDTRLSSLKNRFYTAVPMVRTDIMSALKQKGIYTLDPESANAYSFGAAFCILIPFAIFQYFGWADFFSSVPMLILSILISALIWWLFARVMTAKTVKGARTHVAVLGFQEFMNRVDADRLKVMPPSTFEKFLPYAMALGVEHHWAQAFAGIIKDPPSWYAAPAGYGYGTGFNPILFSNSMHGMATDMHQVFVSAPRSSSTGSGFGGGGGGGGFSGGGFGGGGGSAF